METFIIFGHEQYGGQTVLAVRTTEQAATDALHNYRSKAIQHQATSYEWYSWECWTEQGIQRGWSDLRGAWATPAH